jgi:hypothetical protein
MQTTLGQLVSELVESYERMYEDPELAAVATSVTLEEMLHSQVARRGRKEDTVRIRRVR